MCDTKVGSNDLVPMSYNNLSDIFTLRFFYVFFLIASVSVVRFLWHRVRLLFLSRNLFHRFFHAYLFLLQMVCHLYHSTRFAIVRHHLYSTPSVTVSSPEQGKYLHFDYFIVNLGSYGIFSHPYLSASSRVDSLSFICHGMFNKKKTAVRQKDV